MPSSAPTPTAWAIVLCGACLACSRAPAPPRHLLLVTLDTWRGDHLGAEHAGVRLTPALDELARGAVVFTDASSVAAETSPGAAALLTGLFPHTSGVLRNANVLPPGLPSLATRLREHGFATAAFVANPVLEPGNGFESGFDEYALVRPREGERKARAAELLERASAWIEAQADGVRLFAWVHLMDPHGPYLPHGDDLALFDLETFGEPRELARQPAGTHSGEGGVPHYQWRWFPERVPDARDYLARYKAEVHGADRALGDFLSRLRASGGLEESLVIVSADHGEALEDDHGYFFSHANDLTQDQIHVPLVVAWRGCEAGSVVDRAVSTVDVLPTALARLGLPVPADVDGVDLFGTRPSAVVAASRRELALRDGEWKLRVRNRSEYVLTDLARDPTEGRSLADREPARLRRLVNRLQELQSRPPLSRPLHRDRLTDEQQEELDALGYL